MVNVFIEILLIQPENACHWPTSPTNLQQELELVVIMRCSPKYLCSVWLLCQNQFSTTISRKIVLLIYFKTCFWDFSGKYTSCTRTQKDLPKFSKPQFHLNTDMVWKHLKWLWKNDTKHRRHEVFFTILTCIDLLVCCRSLFMSEVLVRCLQDKGPISISMGSSNIWCWRSFCYDGCFFCCSGWGLTATLVLMN